MTAKNISSTNIRAEGSYMGPGTGDTYTIALQENLDTSSLVREAIEDTTIRSSVWDCGNGATLGLRQGELTLVCDLPGLEATGTKDKEAEILDIVIGPSHTGTTTKVDDASPSANEFDVASAVGLLATDMILVSTSTGNRVAPIESILSSTLTLAVPLPEAPGDEANVYAGVTHIPSVVRNTFVLNHYMDNDKLAYTCKGVHFLPQITQIGAAEGKARLTLAGTIGDWEHTTSLITSAAAPDAFARPGVVQDGGWFVLTDGTKSITCIASTFTIDGLLTAIRRADACRQNTVGEPEIIPDSSRSITADLWQPAGGSGDPIQQLREWWEAGTMLKCLYQVGHNVTDCFAMYFPGVYLMAEPKETDKGGLMAITAQLKVAIDRNSSVWTKPFYLARF